MRKIRFAIGLRDFSREKGGAERYLVDLCTRMAGEGYEVHVYAEQWDVEDSRIFFHSVRTIPFPKSLRLLSFAIRATEEIENGNYDITFGVGNTLKADILQPHGGVHWAWFWRSLRAYDHPILWTIKLLGRVFSLKQWASGWVEDAPYRMKPPPRFIAISDMVRQDMMRWYKIPADQIHVIYNGVDIERFHPRNRQFRQEIRRRHGIGDERVILFVSNNYWMKGLGSLMKALADLKKEDHPPFKLLVLGRDRQGPYQRLAKKIGILEEMVFAGSTDEPEKYYGAADFLVHPAFYDSFSLTVLEALACGLPVITTSTTGASGILNHGEDGFVIRRTRDLEELKMAIRYFSNEKIRHHASRLGRIKAEGHSNRVNFSEIDRVLKDMINACLPKGDQYG